jgi:hypothetical protein
MELGRSVYGSTFHYLAYPCDSAPLFCNYYPIDEPHNDLSIYACAHYFLLWGYIQVSICSNVVLRTKKTTVAYIYIYNFWYIQLLANFDYYLLPFSITLEISGVKVAPAHEKYFLICIHFYLNECMLLNYLLLTFLVSYELLEPKQNSIATASKDCTINIR